MAKKKNKLKRVFKIIGGVIVFLTLPTLLLFGFVYLKYNEPLPEGKSGVEAGQLATKMLTSLNYEAYKNTDYLEWTFKDIHSYKWYKSADSVEVNWSNFRVVLNTKDNSTSKVFVADQLYEGIEKQKYINKAENYFNNDSFWLVAPYKVFDKGTERKIVKSEDGNKSLLVTYTSGGSTPGDSYLWHLDENGKPISYQMWVNILPIGGLEATWNDWILTDSELLLAQSHKLLFMTLEMTNIKGLKDVNHR